MTTTTITKGLTAKQIYQKKYYKKMSSQKLAAKRTKRVNKINSNFDVFLDHTYKSLKRGAAYRGISFKLSFVQYKKLIKNNPKCKFTGLKVVYKIKDPLKASVDRINSDYGYYPSNCQIVTAEVNQFKRDSKDNDVIRISKLIAKHNS